MSKRLGYVEVIGPDLQVKSRGHRGINFFVLLSACFAVSQIFYYEGVSSVFLACSILLIAVIFFVALFYLKDEDGFYLIFFIASTRIITGIGADRELPDLTVAALFLLIFFLRNRRVAHVHLPKVFWIYSVLIILVVVNGLQAPFGARVTGFLRRWQFISALTCFLAGFYLTTSLSFAKFTKVMFYFYLTVMIVAFAMFLGNVKQLPLFNTFSWEILEGYGGRFGILSVSGSICFTVLVCKKDFLKNPLFRSMVYLLSLLAVVSGGGRAAIIGVILSFFLYLYFLEGKKKTVLGIALGGILLIQLTSISSIRRYVPDRFQRAFDFGRIDMVSYAAQNISSDHLNLDMFVKTEADWSTLGRLMLWTQALSSIPQNPWLGRGLGDLYAGESKSSVTTQEMMSNKALLETGDLHNTYVSIAYTFGIPALLAFVVLVGTAAIYSYRLASLSAGEYAFIFVYFGSLLIQGLAGDIYFDYQFMMILGMIYSRYSLLKKNSAPLRLEGL